MRNLSKRDGWTLIEIMVVVVILGIITGFAITQYESAIAKAAMREHKLAFAKIHAANEVYKAKYGHYLCDHSSGATFLGLGPNELLFGLGLTTNPSDQYPFATGNYNSPSQSACADWNFNTLIQSHGKRFLPSQYRCNVEVLGDQWGAEYFNPRTLTNTSFCKSLWPYLGP